MQNYESIVKKTHEDKAFKAELIKNPKKVLKDLGYNLDDKITITVHEDSSKLMHFVLLSKDQMEMMNLGNDPIVGKVMVRAYGDAKYKARLLKDPIPAVEEVLGIKPPTKIVIHENTANEIHLVLPDNPKSSRELNDADLALVAGGKGFQVDFNTVGAWMIQSGDKMSTVGAGIRKSFGAENPVGLLFSGLGPMTVGGGNVLQKTYAFLTKGKNKTA